jgi:16S rRNA (cytidine1402-2'-O)-methyltransferase
MTGTLYIAGTPIGNLSDVTARFAEIAPGVEHIAAEDTRVAGKLFQHVGGDHHFHALHEQSDERDYRKVIDLLMRGEDVVFVSDAGTPGVSDPGGKLIELAVREDITVTPIPGISAVTTLLSAAHFPVVPFTFMGFPPAKRKRNAFFDSVNTTEHAVLLFESKHRLMKLLDALEPDRELLIGREMTKLHESFYRGTVYELKQTNIPIKGEFALLLAPKSYERP